MWRAFFLAMGVYVMLLGLECLGIQKFVLKAREPIVHQAQQSFLFVTRNPALGPNKELVPPPWAPWTLLSTGAVVCLYSFSIPHRMTSK